MNAPATQTAATRQDTPSAVTVVIPAYNERDAIADQVANVREVLASTGWQFDIIVVDDGSTDGTSEVLAGIDVRVIRLDDNRGYGSALKAGIAAATTPFVLITDADGTYPTREIPGLLAVAHENDMVVGSRTGAVVKIPLMRKPAKWFLRWYASYLTEREIPDLNSGMRVIRTSLVRRFWDLLPPGFSFTTTITIASLCDEYRVQYVPIEYHARIGQSKIRKRDAWNFLILIMRTTTYFRPHRVFVPIALGMFFVAMVKVVIDFYMGDIQDTVVLFVLAGLLTLCVSLLADVLAYLRRRMDRESGR